MMQLRGKGGATIMVVKGGFCVSTWCISTTMFLRKDRKSDRDGVIEGVSSDVRE
jgi:hypothetical protein